MAFILTSDAARAKAFCGKTLGYPLLPRLTDAFGVNGMFNCTTKKPM